MHHDNQYIMRFISIHLLFLQKKKIMFDNVENYLSLASPNLLCLNELDKKELLIFNSFNIKQLKL